ncbi:MAG: SGNH/GDSL hydrolase family protein [Hyphomicrobiales bacterium]|nr:SGNH/GDSL hydrolase family protein [Hyphomicrobiales bacterium]
MPHRGWTEYVTAGTMAALALLVSPPGIALATGRADLSFRVTAVSVVLAAFLLLIAASIVVRGRVRQMLFVLLAMLLPVAGVACLELASIGFRLADRVAPLEDTSSIVHRDRWPGHLMSEARWQPGLRLYRPWQGPGIAFNALGLRTAAPTPKAPGEWRIAVSGGSAVWGWRVLDADTIPAQLGRLSRADRPEVSFFNFGIEGVTIAQELELLKRFREVYELDQVIFYTGANDAFGTYLEMAGARNQIVDATNGVASFELVKAVARLRQIMTEPSAATLDGVEREMVSRLERDDRLRRGVQAADAYCETSRLRCDFLLQPLLFSRSRPTGPEERLLRTFRRLYPGFAAVAAGMYRDARAALPTSKVHDLSHIFDNIAEPVFTDQVHVNELGNRVASEAIRASVSFGPGP